MVGEFHPLMIVLGAAQVYQSQLMVWSRIEVNTKRFKHPLPFRENF